MEMTAELILSGAEVFREASSLVDICGGFSSGRGDGSGIGGSEAGHGGRIYGEGDERGRGYGGGLEGGRISYGGGNGDGSGDTRILSLSEERVIRWT